jgi:hypothetical protein
MSAHLSEFSLSLVTNAGRAGFFESIYMSPFDCGSTRIKGGKTLENLE